MSAQSLRCTPMLALVLFSALATADEPIPSGEIAKSQGQGITEAFFSCPTDRYPHGVLGDRIEGGCLIVTDDTGTRHTRILPETQVFEDLTPRIADIDNDGRNDVVVVLSSVSEGASLAVYGLTDERLSLIAGTPYIGKPYRWLAPAAIADLNGDGKNEIAYVETPHIGGTLRIWGMQDGELQQLGQYKGVSNHAIGSTRVSVSKVLDHNKDGLQDLALPDDSSSHILIFSLLKDELLMIDRMPMDRSLFE